MILYASSPLLVPRPFPAVHTNRAPSRIALVALVALVAGGCDCGSDDRPRDDGGARPMELPIPPGEPNGLLFGLRSEKDAEGDVVRIVATTDSGRPAQLFYTPIPSHSLPHSGSPAVEYKPNFQAFPLLGDADLEDASGGSCDEPEPCRVPASQILGLRIPFVTPARVRITHVRWEGRADGTMYAGTTDSWTVRMRVGEVSIEAGHLGWIGPELRRRMIEAGAPDPDTFGASDPPTSTQLLPEGADIVLEEGEVFAYPQLNTNCFQTVGRHCVPFSQIEFTYGTYEPPPSNIPLHLSPYRFLDDSIRADLNSWMATNMVRRTNGYANFEDNAWVFLAEARIETQTEAEYLATNTIFGRFGEWYENTDTSYGPCPDPAPYCNEGFFFWRVLRDTDAFDPDLYENPNLNALMIHSERGSGTRDDFLTGEIVVPDDPDPIADTIVTRWRDLGIDPLASDCYQAYRYALAGGVLTVVKGTERATRAEAEADATTLADPATATCDGQTVVCLHRNFINQLPGGN